MVTKGNRAALPVFVVSGDRSQVAAGRYQKAFCASNGDALKILSLYLWWALGSELSVPKLAGLDARPPGLSQRGDPARGRQGSGSRESGHKLVKYAT